MECKGSVSSWPTVLTAICCTHSHTLVWSARVLCQVDWQSLLPFAAHSHTLVWSTRLLCQAGWHSPYCTCSHTLVWSTRVQHQADGQSPYCSLLHTQQPARPTQLVTAGHLAPQVRRVSCSFRGIQLQRTDTSGRSEQSPNHPQPKPLPVHSAAGSTHQQSDSTASSGHAKVTLNLPKASLVRNHFTLPHTS